MDDVSQVVVILDMNQYFWARKPVDTSGTGGLAGLSFNQFLRHALMFMNSIQLLNHLNQLVVIATGAHSCCVIYKSGIGSGGGFESGRSVSKCSSGQHLSPSSKIMEQLELFLSKEEAASVNVEEGDLKDFPSLLSGSLSMALCYIQRCLRAGSPSCQQRILCLQGASDAPQQYVAVMNAIFSAQRAMVPIDACIVGSHHSPFLQQAAHITGGIYMKPPQLEGLFEYLTVVFATDLHSRKFLQLAHPVLLSQENYRHGLCLFCLPLNLLQTS
eukprot:c19632_g1_i1 orf=878-1693(-)